MATLRFEKLTMQSAFWLNLDATGESIRMAQLFGALVENPLILGEAVRRAFAETLLPAIREAWVARLPKAVDMHVVQASGLDLARHRARDDAIDDVAGRHGLVDSAMRDISGEDFTFSGDAHTPDPFWSSLRVHHTERASGTAEGHTLNQIYNRMRAAQMRNDPARFAAMQRRLEEHRDRFIASLQRRKDGSQKSSHPLSSGLFRARAMEVMDLFVNPTYLQPRRVGNTVVVGVGPLDQLERIQTPSATEFSLGHGSTPSKYNVLWRQLEFGTGTFALPYSRNGWAEKGITRYNEGLPEGLWYWGKTLEDAGLVLQGSEGIHSLFDQRGVLAQNAAFVEAVFKNLRLIFAGKFGPVA